MAKKIYIGEKAGDAKFISQRRPLGVPGPIAGTSKDTTPCLWCGKMFNAALASCGTGTTWSLYQCPHCNKLMASGNIVPAEVKNNPRIAITKGG